MNDILYRAAAYLLIIALGVFLKKVGFFHEQDFLLFCSLRSFGKIPDKIPPAGPDPAAYSSNHPP